MARCPLSLGSRDPLQQLSARDRFPIERPNNCIGHQKSLMREKNQGQPHLGSVSSDIAPYTPEMAAPGDAAGMYQETRGDVEVNWKGNRQHDKESPNHRRSWK